MEEEGQSFLERTSNLTLMLIVLILLSIVVHVIDTIIDTDLGTFARGVDYIVAIVLVIFLINLVRNKMTSDTS